MASKKTKYEVLKDVTVACKETGTIHLPNATQEQIRAWVASVSEQEAARLVREIRPEVKAENGEGK